MSDPLSDPELHRPLAHVGPDLEDVPSEENISAADAVDRLDEDPEEQKNFTETHGQRSQVDQPEPDGPAEPDGASGPRDREESIELDAPEYDEA
jgi:hypothetical protein